jgi:hypothetical protein
VYRQGREFAELGSRSTYAKALMKCPVCNKTPEDFREHALHRGELCS